MVKADVVQQTEGSRPEGGKARIQVTTGVLAGHESKGVRPLHNLPKIVAEHFILKRSANEIQNLEKIFKRKGA